MDDSDVEEPRDVWKLEECWMQHNKEEKAALRQLYAEVALEGKPDVNKISVLVQSSVFIRVPVDHMCFDRFFNGLEAACFKGNVDLVRLLLRHGADVQGKKRNSKSRYWQPLHLACQSKAPTSTVLKVVKLLVEGGASISEHDGNDALPIMHAVDSNHAEVVGFLLNQGADPNGWFYGTPPLIMACARDDTKIHPSIVSTLLLAGADPNIPSFNQDCLKQACFQLSVEKLLLLFAYRVRLGVGSVTLGDIKSLMEIVLQKTSSSDATHKENYFTILELLLAAGLKFATHDRKWIENEIVTFDFEENLALGIELIEGTLTLFNSCVFTPKKLSSLCRSRIRSCILPDIDVNLRSLPVPSSVRSFLRFGDIVVRATYSSDVAVAEL